MQEPTEYPCVCGDLRMAFQVKRRLRRPKIVYLCHTCDRDHPIIARRLALSARWKAEGRGSI